MGIFSDRCQALIDENGRALSGETLEAARKDQRAPRCGNKVKKTARFCSKCGSPPPGAWWQCPSCGKWVGAESNFCWNCKTELYPDQRTDFASGRWKRPAGCFAERFEVGDLHKLLEDGLVIEEGTCALLLDAGKYKDVLGPGRHTLESCARKINHWGDPPPRTLVMVHAGDLVLPVRFEDLRSADELEVRFYSEVIVRFDPREAVGFITNLMGGNRRLEVEQLQAYLEGEIRYGATNFCNATNIEDIVKDPDRRLRLEDSLSEALKVAGERVGIEIVRLSAVEFYGKAYEQLRQKAGDVEARRRELEFEQILREAEKTDKLGQFKTEHDLEAYVNQLAHERGVSSEKQQQELARLQRGFEREQGALDVEHEESLKDRQSEGSIGRNKAQHAADLDMAAEALELKRRKRELQREDLEKRGDLFSKMDFKTLAALVDDPEKRAALQKMQQQESLKGRSPEEILALTATDDPQAMLVLKEILADRTEEKAAELDKRESLGREHAAQLERIMDKALEKMGDAAKGGDSQTTINK